MYGYGSVAFVVSGELSILTNGRHMGRWNIERENQFHLSATDRICCSCQPPLIVDSLVLIANDGRVEKLSLESYSFIS